MACRPQGRRGGDGRPIPISKTDRNRDRYRPLGAKEMPLPEAAKHHARLAALRRYSPNSSCAALIASNAEFALIARLLAPIRKTCLRDMS